MNMRKKTPINYCTYCGYKVSIAIPDGDNRERHVCVECGEIQYQNPKIVVGCVPEIDNRILLCKRAIEPRHGFWTVPAGFMELGETIAEGAARETLLEFMRLDATPNVSHPYLDRLFEPIVALIAEGQAAGEIRSDRDAAFLTQMTVGMMNSAVTNWLAHPDYPVEEGLLEAMEFAIETLRPTDRTH